MPPFIHFEWDEPDPGEDIEFTFYTIYREEEDGSRTRLKNIGSIVEPFWDYYEAPPGQYTYYISWTGVIGGSPIESELVPVTPTMVFEDGWLHDPNDPSYAVRVTAQSVDRSYQPEVTWELAGGAEFPSMFVRRGRRQEWNLTLLPRQASMGEAWNQLDALIQRQFSHASILCLRLGFRPGERHFVGVGEAREKISGGQAEINLQATTVQYTEAI